MEQPAERKIPRQKLWTLTYTDLNANVRLKTYADTIVFDGEKNILMAVRFGGYPEHVNGMADAIFGGGTVRFGIEGEKAIELRSMAKQYRRSVTNDGLYTEATLLIQDDRLESDEKEDGDETENAKQEKLAKDLPRTGYIFCEQDDTDRLFEEIDRKVSVPLIPAFKDYAVTEMLNRKILKKLTVISIREKFDAWKISLTPGEKNVIKLVEDGLKAGIISIPAASESNPSDDETVNNSGEIEQQSVPAVNPFDGIKTVSNYLDAFGVTIAEKIKGQFNPLFDPSTEKLSKEILTVNSFIKRKAGYSLYAAQLAEAEAMKRRLDKSKFALCVAECGSGKTKIGSTALCAHQKGKGQAKTFNIVLCPSHLSKKWVREIEESLPNTFAVHIKSITELHRVYATYEKDRKSCYVIITKEKARDGYMTCPSVKWDTRRYAFLCPRCDAPVMMDVIDDGAKYKVEADQFFFQKENSKNHKCEKCGEVLWSVLIPDSQGEWIKISNYGFVHREQALTHQKRIRRKVIKAQTGEADIDDLYPDENIKFPKYYHDIKAVTENPSGDFRAAGAYVRFPLSTYINKKMRGKVDGLIVDELQDYNNDSGQGDAMNELFSCAKKVVGLTGTLINGYSQGIFYLLYRVAPYLMQLDDKAYAGTKEFNNEYGVTESVYEISDPEYNSNRRTVRRKIREKQLPGVSPLVYTRFLIESAAFLSLNDMGKQLPEYEEIPVVLSMADEVKREYERIETEFVNILKHNKKIAQKVMSAFMSLLTVYPDQPYGMKPILNPINGKEIIKAQDKSSFDVLNEKDLWLLEKVKEKIQQGGRVIVYTSWVRLDTQEKLSKLFKKNNIRTEVLTSSVAPNKREEWVEKRVRDGVKVLITNPSLVETGLDLNDFATLVYYNIGYKLFTLRQSSRRSWRINQRAPRVEVYFLYFENVMQHRAIRLMASKLAVAGIIEGNFTDEGLAAMSECQDLTTLLAQELTLGIKNEVEDLGAVFKKMAILKPEGEQESESEQKYESELDALSAQATEYDIIDMPLDFELAETNDVNVFETFQQQNPIKPTVHQAPITPKRATVFDDAALPAVTTVHKKKNIKAVYIDPNQLSLFDVGFDIPA